MWKTSSYESLPTDTLSKWVEGCKSLNKLDYVFHLYDDDYLRKFTETNYPAYFRLFKTLTGVCKCPYRFQLVNPLPIISNTI